MTTNSTTVIGAGIIGTLIAYEIATRAPHTQVTVVDRDAVGCGASRRSAGLHLPRGGTERIRAMSRYSEDFYRKLVENLVSVPIYPLPDTSVVTSQDNETRTQEVYLPQAAMTRLAALPNDDVRLPEGSSLWQINGSHHADVYGVSATLARELRDRVRFREGVRVTALETSGDDVHVDLSTGDRLVSDRVVLAPGPWLSAPAWKDLLAPLGLRVKKIVALHIERVPTERDRAIVFHDEDAFLIPLLHRAHWLFCYTCQDWDVDPDDLHDGLSAGNLENALQCLRSYSPRLAEDCTSGRVFCDAYSSTGEPQVRSLAENGRIIFAGAANGSGYRLAPAIAAEAADLLGLPADSRSLA
jgi:glycine/D-amino acid oxidase-like deaminating enzyme